MTARSTTRKPRRTRCKVCGRLYMPEPGTGCPELCENIRVVADTQEVVQEQYRGYLLITVGVVHNPGLGKPPLELVSAHRRDPDGAMFYYTALYQSHEQALGVMIGHIDTIRAQQASAPHDGGAEGRHED